MFGITTKEIQVTDAARAHLKRVVGDLAGLRLALVKGGCAEFEYDLQAVSVDTINPTDERLEIEEGLTVFIPTENVLKLFGSTIDFAEDSIGNRNIKIVSPLAKNKCGCGQSFSF